MTNQITDTKLLENQILGNQIAGRPHYHVPFAITNGHNKLNFFFNGGLQFMLCSSCQKMISYQYILCKYFVVYL